MKVACFVALAILVLGSSPSIAQDAAAQNGIFQQWAGRVGRPQAVQVPTKGFVTTAEEFSQLWQALQLKSDPPIVDFSKYLVLVATSRSSLFKVRAIQVDESGDLKTVVMATPDLMRDYALVMTQVARAGVKSVHGQSVGQ